MTRQLSLRALYVCSDLQLTTKQEWVMTWNGIKALSSASNARIRVVDSASWKIKKQTLLSMQKKAISHGELPSFDG